uniref:Lipid scramblase CLPTM1L n=1 Tax=Electrophorus electricus TaxID=8005 RepID=A0AAY5ESZ1_ELEEL
MFQKTSLTTIIVGVFIVYVLHTCWVMYGIVYTKPCEKPKGDSCITPYLAGKPRLQLSIYTSIRPNAEGGHSLIHKEEEFDVHTRFERLINVSLPKKTRRNGTLYAMVFVHQAGVMPWQDPRQVHLVTQLTTYMLPKPPEVSLIQGQDEHLQQERQSTGGDGEQVRPVSHWRSRLTLNIVAEDFLFDRDALPSDVHRYMRVFNSGKKMFYLPLLFIDELSNRVKDLMEINSSTAELPLTISYDTIALGKLRFWIHMQDAVYSLQQFGFTEKDADEIKGIFVDTNLYFLALTFFVAAFHVSGFLVCYQQKIYLMPVLFPVLWRCFSTIVIFLYLLDEQTSLLVLIPAGIGSLIEVWKVKKAFKIYVVWKGAVPQFLFGKSDESERRTEEYDSLAMKYLSYLLYPLCVGGAVYALVFVKYKSWYSWLINSLVNGMVDFFYFFFPLTCYITYIFIERLFCAYVIV